MQERCDEYCDERNEWEEEERENVVPDKIRAWVAKILRIIIAEINAKADSTTKKKMLKGARAALAPEDFEVMVQDTVDELINDELNVLHPEEEESDEEVLGIIQG